jgi:hypothetical protein
VSGLDGDFTIEAWVYWKGGCPLASHERTWQRIFDFGTDLSNFMCLVPQSDYGGGNGVMFALVVDSAVEYVQSAEPLSTNTWHHIAVTVNSSNTAKLYIDGKDSGTGYITNRPAAFGTGADNKMGLSKFVDLYNDPYFYGNIDEFQISNTVRYTSDFFPATVPFPADANTVALFHFNEGPGHVETYDVTGLVGILGSSDASEASDPSWMNASTLPVTMMEFSGTKAGNAVSLKWKADVKGDGGAFLVERSRDGFSFERIGSVPIAGGSGVYQFSFTDPQPGTGRIYYRLKIAENGSSPKYTTIVLVDLRGRSIYTLYPTLASSTLFIGTPKAIDLSVYNSSGAIVKRLRLTASSQVSIADLPAGSYLVRIEGETEVLRFVKN